jgi:hypothetical protein
MNYNTFNANLQGLLEDINIKSDLSYQTNRIVSRYYMDNGKQEQANRVNHCCEYIEVIQSENSTIVTKLNRCMNRLCPTCAAVTARERFYNIMPVIDALTNEHNFPAHVMFSIPNQKAEHISETISQLNKSIFRFAKAFEVENYTRNIEITYNNDFDTYHIHAHCIFIIEHGTRLAPFYVRMPKAEFDEIMTMVRSKWTRTARKQGIRNIKTEYLRVYIRAMDNPKYVIECTKYNFKSKGLPMKAVYNIADGIEKKRLFEVYGQEMKEAYKKQKEINNSLHKAYQYDKYINLPEKYLKATLYKNTKASTYTLHDISLCKKSDLFSQA